MHLLHEFHAKCMHVQALEEKNEKNLLNQAGKTQPLFSVLCSISSPYKI